MRPVTRSLYWEVTAKMPKKIDDLHRLHRTKQYVTGREQDGNVLIIQNPEVYESYTVEQWGNFNTFDDFVEKGTDCTPAGYRRI